MKFFTPSALFAAALLSAAAVIPFLPANRRITGDFALEARLTATVGGHVQVYYDSGEGFQESQSTSLPIEQTDMPRLYRLNLPAGTYRALRFDPIDREGIVTIEGTRVVDRQGRLVRDLPLSAFKAQSQIQSLQVKEGRLEVVPTPGSNDPQLAVELGSPLRLSMAWSDRAESWLGRALGVFAALAAALAALERCPRLRRASAEAVRRIALRPVRAVMLVSALAVIASAYPVVFLGKSYVSPHFGSVLLYDQWPTLPGGGSNRTAEVSGSDVGAIMWQHVPFSMIQHRALLRDGELPWWDRYDSGGAPLLGQGQSMFGDPLHFLVIAADGAAWAWDLKYLVAKWLFATGLGLLALAVARHARSALIVSLAAPFVGFFVFRVNHPAFFSLCYAPWALLGWVRVAQADGRRATAGWCGGLIAANLALMGSGTAKEAYVLLLAMNFSGACALLASAEPWRRRLAKFAALAWAGVLFAMMTAPLWGTFAATLKASYTNYDAPTAYQIQPSLLLGAFDEALYRPLTQGALVFDPSANFLILAGLLYFLATLRHQFANRTATALAGSSLVPLAFAFGFMPPAWIVRMPILSNVAHLDNSFTCALIVLWAVLAGAGFAAAAARLGSREGRADLAIAGSLLFGLVFLYVGFGQAVHRTIFGPGLTFSPLQPGESIHVPPFVRGYLAALLAAVAGLGLLARRALRQGALKPAAALGLALCAAILLWRQGLQAEAAGFESYVVRPPERVNLHAKSDAMGFVQKAQGAAPARGIGLQNNFFPGWTGVYGLEGISGPDALMNPFYRELTVASPLQRLWDWRLYLTRGTLAAARPFLDFLNVRYYFDLKSDRAALGAVLKLDRTGDLDVYESSTAWPRAFFTDRLAIYDTVDELEDWIAHGDGRPFAAAQSPDLAGEPGAAALPGGLAGRDVVAADNYRLTESTTSFEIGATGPGIVVLDEAFWKGYSHAEIDGRPVRVMRVNHAFQGIAIDAPGTYRVSFHYRPAQSPLMLGLSAGGFVLLLASGGLVWKRATPRRPASA